jgi:two-component system sensor histidine kinase/response regulator
VKILIVEDDSDTRAIVRISLEGENLEIIEAVDGEHAKELLTQENVTLPDLIISDIMMPRCDGHQLLRWFRENITHTYIPVIFLTALDEIENRISGLEMGADDYLTKPFHPGELLARVRALLRIKSLTDSLKQTQALLVEKEKELLKTELVGGVAHALGQPITAIALNCFVMEQEFVKLALNSPALISALESIKKDCQTIKGSLQQLKEISANSTTQYLPGVKILDF